jgi:hypothetical protein
MKTSFKFRNENKLFNPGDLVTRGNAIIMRDAYRNHTNHLTVTLPGPGGKPITPILEGLRIPIAAIKEIMGIPAATPVQIDELHVMFGLDTNDPTKHFTTIFGGIKNDDPINHPNGRLITDKLYNYCDSCPPKTPTFI